MKKICKYLNDKAGRTRKLWICLIALNLLALIYISLNIVNTLPAQGYEVSIYSAYPIYIWYLICAFYIVNLASIIISKSNVSGYISLVGLFSATIMISALPLQRGYFCIDGGDTLSHLTYVNNFINEGHLGLYHSGLDPYPVIHLVAAGLYYLGIPLNQTIQVTPLLCYTWFIIFSFLASKEILKSNKIACVITALFLIPVIKFYYCLPSLLAIYLIPSFFYFIIKKWWIPASIVAILIPISHPAVALHFFILLIICGITIGLKYKWWRERGYLIVSGVFMVVWGTLLVVFKDSTINILNIEFKSMASIENVGMAFREINDIVKLSNMPVPMLSVMYAMYYGKTQVLMILSGAFSVAYLWYRFRQHIKNQSFILVISYAVLLFVSSYILSYIFVSSYVIGKGYYLLYLVSFLAVGYWVGKWVMEKRRIIMGVTILCLSVLVVISVFSYYDSPYNRKPSQQITVEEVEAVEWILANNESGLMVYDLLRQQQRMANYILGCDYGEADNLEEVNTLNARGLPFHFGYDEHDTIGEAMGEECYLITNTKNIQISTIIYPEYSSIWAYHPDDYERLENDKSAALMWEEGSVRIYRINGLGGIE